MSTSARRRRQAAGAALSRDVGRFDAPADRAAIDGLVRWVEDRYRDDLQERPSKHVYVRTLPASAVGRSTGCATARSSAT